jgi:hypothetical protein
VTEYDRDQAAKNGGRPSGMRVLRIADVDARLVTWLEDGLIPRAMLTGLVAPGGTVKGLLGVHLAVKLAKKGERSLFVCSEDALDYIVRPRFMAAGCDATLAFALDFEEADGGALGSVAFEDACRCVITAARDNEDEDVCHVELTKSNVGPTGYGRKLRIVEVPIEIEGETVGIANLVDEGRSAKSVPHLLSQRKPPGPDPTQREAARARLVELLSATPGSSVNAGETKKNVAAELDTSESTVWRAFTELKREELAGAEAIKDESGAILEWRWYAKPALLLGDEIQ